MNINIFFLFISIGLLMIFFLFKPLDIKEREFVDIPVFELKSFTLYELNTKGLSTIMIGDSAIRYSDRYRVSNINYTDNSKEYIANMKADNGTYKDEIVNLNGNVIYQREDGLSFETQKASYNKKTKIAYANTDYISYMGTNRVVGKSLIYNNLSKRVKSQSVVAKYQLQEE
ncbi:MAG: LPS export ABC transporter periplasmic protein LptC [Campylobacterota bacterium]|nr:LPS export ABC transporter periplasmic protein LptC [Campylobacterota bacterium]